MTTEAIRNEMQGQPCPCGSGACLADCCGRLLSRRQQAATAEELMRSRYAAYVTGTIDYLVDTHDPATVQATDRENAAAWSRSVIWQGLRILSTERGGAGDDEGIVEFIASYSSEGSMLSHHERSRFRRIRGRWVYVDGIQGKSAPIVRGTPKPGRNDPCLCGSGKKYKKCCGR